MRTSSSCTMRAAVSAQAAWASAAPGSPERDKIDTARCKRSGSGSIMVVSRSGTRLAAAAMCPGYLRCRLGHVLAPLRLAVVAVALAMVDLAALVDPDLPGTAANGWARLRRIGQRGAWRGCRRRRRTRRHTAVGSAQGPCVRAGQHGAVAARHGLCVGGPGQNGRKGNRDQQVTHGAALQPGPGGTARPRNVAERHEWVNPCGTEATAMAT